MAKSGILHDYDLHANLETSAQDRKCAICGASPMAFQWSDYSGEGMCCNCGCPYQLKWGSEKRVEEGKYPYLNLRKEWLEVAQEYFNETKKWTYLGTGFSRPGMQEFIEWVEKKHPEMLKEEEPVGEK